MVRLSVNVNKIATLRNSRGGSVPSVTDAVQVCLDAGVTGITVHPREDARHITLDDVRAIADQLAPLRDMIEYNIEGDPRPDLMELVREIKPHQCTLVPVRPGEITSEAGWPADTPAAELRAVIDSLQEQDIRVSLFIDPTEQAIRWAASMGADRIELYTEPYARAFEAGEPPAQDSFSMYREAAELAHSLGLGINAGHDLDLDNLLLFKQLPHLDEVSIGHAIISDAVFRGLDAVVKDYLQLLAN